MKYVIIISIFAACGYGAYEHMHSQERRIAKADATKQATLAEKTTIERDLALLTQSIQEASAKLEAEKARSLEQTKASMEAEFQSKKAHLELELKTLETDSSPEVYLQKMTALNEEIKKTEAALKKASLLNETLNKYVKTEEDAQNKSRRQSRSSSSGATPRIYVY